MDSPDLAVLAATVEDLQFQIDQMSLAMATLRLGINTNITSGSTGAVSAPSVQSTVKTIFESRTNIVWLSAAANVINSGAGVAIPWTTFNAQSAIPIGASVAILQVQALATYGGIMVYPYIQVRKDSASQALQVWGSNYTGVAPGPGYVMYPAVQVFVPMTADRKFDYQCTAGIAPLQIDLIGYL